MESHCGDPNTFYNYIYADSDEEAKKELANIRKLPQNGYSQLTMERIDVEEKITYIS
jgi:hypothetical protein